MKGPLVLSGLFQDQKQSLKKRYCPIKLLNVMCKDNEGIHTSDKQTGNDQYTSTLVAKFTCK